MSRFFIDAYKDLKGQMMEAVKSLEEGAKNDTEIYIADYRAKLGKLVAEEASIDHIENMVSRLRQATIDRDRKQSVANYLASQLEYHKNDMFRIGCKIKVTATKSRLKTLWSEKYADDLHGKTLRVEDIYNGNDTGLKCRERWAVVSVGEQGYKLPQDCFEVVDESDIPYPSIDLNTDYEGYVYDSVLSMVNHMGNKVYTVRFDYLPNYDDHRIAEKVNRMIKEDGIRVDGIRVIRNRDSVKEALDSLIEKGLLLLHEDLKNEDGTGIDAYRVSMILPR
jgi:hypothetical protein